MKIVQADARTGLAIGPWSFLMSHALLIGIQIPHSKRVLNDAFNHICSMHICFSTFTFVFIHSFGDSFSMYGWMASPRTWTESCQGFRSLIRVNISTAVMLRTSDWICIFFLGWCAATNRKQYVLSILPYDLKLPTVTC